MFQLVEKAFDLSLGIARGAGIVVKVDAQHHSSLRAGTVLSASRQTIWVLMDDRFNPALMSGTPLLSQRTGQAVGMAVAASPRGGRLLLGADPIKRRNQSCLHCKKGEGALHVVCA